MATTPESKFRAGTRVQFVADSSKRGVVDDLGMDDRGMIARVVWDKTPTLRVAASWENLRDLRLEETPREKLEQELVALSEVVAETSGVKGFEQATWNAIPGHLMFVVTEIHEAWDSPDRDALAEEIADIAIRLLVLLRNLWGDVWQLPESPLARNEREGMSLTVELMRVLRHLSSAAREWRSGYTVSNKSLIREELEAALSEVVGLAEGRRIDILAAVAAKNAKNARRPHLHGRAEAIG